MTLEIYQDDEVDPPERVRRVSFATGVRAPLTPHSKKFHVQNTPKNQKSKPQTKTENGKENQPSAVMSLRRQLRATMSPPPPNNGNNKENGKTSSQFNARVDQTKTSSTVLTPSFRHNAQQRKSVKTPKSLLKRELAFNDAEESLLISPGADVSFSLASDTPRRQPAQPLRSPFETVHEVDTDESHKAKEEKVPIFQKAVQEATISVLDKAESRAKEDHATAKLQVPTARVQQRALLRKQRELHPISEAKEETGTTPYRKRGNGVQMDLSSMFTEMASPEIDHETSEQQELVSSTMKQKSQKQTTSTNLPVASLDNICESLWLDFGDERQNQVGSTRTLSFAIDVPDGDDCVAQVERVPFKKGFDLIVDEGCIVETDITPSEQKPTAIRFTSGERVLLTVSWTPLEAGGVREVIYLKLPRGRLSVLVHGKARNAKAPKDGKVRKHTRSSIRPEVDAKSQVVRSTPAPACLPEPATVFAKSSPSSAVTTAAAQQTAQPVVFDEKWADKQCEAFANWMNYTFQPSEDKDHEASLLEEAGEGTETRDRAALRTLILHRRMAQVRARATDLFAGEEMLIVQRAIHVEVSKGRLKLRSDRDMFADLTLRGQITSLLLSYTTPWLRLGLETIFGEIISPESLNHFSPQKAGLAALSRKAERVPLSRMKLTLKTFIVNRVLMDPATLNKYTKGKCNLPSGNFEKKFKAEMRILTLNRLLTLILFLDRAKEAKILDKVPMLFSKTSKVKSSREVLIQLCRDFLSSEGDIIKHLSRIGIRVTYKQSAIDELDYTVNNLAVDLRDGVRLGRVAEILTLQEPKSILMKLRLPAVSRLQKLHNVGSVIDILRDYGVTSLNEIAPHHIVDGHREMVLKLMWSILAYCGLQTIIDAEALEHEIESVHRANCTRSVRGKLGLKGEVFVDIAPVDVTTVGQEGFYKSLLLRWCNAVCSCFGRSASDFSSSFADGTVLCLLIHYYHPGLLPLDSILTTTRHVRNQASNAEQHSQALLRETKNFELAQKTISELGGIPKMVTTANTEDPPDEKSMFLSVAYLCSRLMESSKEILACICIQTCYSRYKRRVELEKKLLAASFILKSWREYRDQYFENQRRWFQGPVLVIERFLLSIKDQLFEMRWQRLGREAKQNAATLIQSHARKMICERKVRPALERSRAALKIQCIWRQYNAMIELELRLIEQDAAVTIQKYWRGFEVRALFQINLDSATFIQARFRGYSERKRFTLFVSAAISIQRIWRGFWSQLQTQLDIMDVITIQSLVRRKIAHVESDCRRRGVIRLQRTFRRILATKIVESMKIKRQELRLRAFAAITCQSAIRRYLSLKTFKKVLQANTATIIIQSKWRQACTRQRFTTTKCSAITLQAMFRGAIVRKSVAIQTRYALLIQKAWRRYCALVRYATQVESVVRIQAAIRSWLVRADIGAKGLAAVTIQSKWRCYTASSSYQKIAKLAIAIQRLRRGLQVRRELQFLGACASAIQATWRRYYAEVQYQVDLIDIILVQSICRRRMAVVEYKKQNAALILIQSLARMCLAQERCSYLREEKMERKRQQAASICLQSVVRRRLAVQARTKQIQAIVLCQSIARRNMILRQQSREVASAVLIQKTWHGFTSFVDYSLTRSDVIIVQAQFRQRLAISVSKNRLRSIIFIQNTTRRWLAIRRVGSMRSERERVLRLEALQRGESATRVQAWFRGHVARHRLALLDAYATSIQCMYRAYISRLDYQMEMIDIILVQSAIRGWAARFQYSIRLESILQIQKFFRVCQAKREMNQLRRLRDIENSKQHGATMIQKTWRCYTVHVDYMLLIISVIQIQTLIRGHQATMKRRTCENNIVMLQSLGRRFLVQKSLRHLAACATIIQSRVRAFLAISRFRFVIAATVSIQSLCRGLLARVDLDLQRFAACEIQRIWRGYRENVDYLIHIIAVITIQSALRSALAKNLLRLLHRQRFLETIELRFYEKKAKLIQQCYGAYLRMKFAANAASIVQAAARGFLCRQRIGGMIEGIILLQAVWRGRLIRRRRTKKARVIAKRVAMANSKALENPDMRLGVRTTSALLILQNSSRLVEIMNAVSTLEVSTRLSRNCCIAFTECEAPEIIYSLVRTCNRSLPHVELLHYVLLTLTNVARHNELRWRVSTEESVEVYMDLVQMFRDKDSVFCLAVALLYKAIVKNRELKQICSSSENIKRLKGIHSLCVRKLSVSNTSRVTRSASAGTKQKMEIGIMDRKKGVHILQKILRILEE